MLQGWLRVRYLREQRSLGSCSLPRPCLAQAYVLHLLAVEERLAHDLQMRQIAHGDQSVRVQLTEGIYVGDHAPRCVYRPVAETGEGASICRAKIPRWSLA